MYEENLLLSIDNMAVRADLPERRARRFRRLAKAFAALFLVVGVCHLALLPLPLIDARLSAAGIECGPPCALDRDPVRLLSPESARKRAWQSPGSEQLILDRLELPAIRWMLVAAKAALSIPVAFIFLAVAMALRSFANAGVSTRGVRWLRRAALAAVAWVIGQQASDSIRMTAFSPVTHGREMSHIVFDANALLVGCLIAAAAAITLWGLEQAIALQRDLEEYV
jgi:hypothetical protein